MNSRLDHPKKPDFEIFLQSNGTPGHDPTKLIMIPIIERLGLFQTRKHTYMSVHTHQDDQIEPYVFSVPLFGGQSFAFHRVFV